MPSVCPLSPDQRPRHVSSRPARDRRSAAPVRARSALRGACPQHDFAASNALRARASGKRVKNFRTHIAASPRASTSNRHKCDLRDVIEVADPAEPCTGKRRRLSYATYRDGSNPDSRHWDDFYGFHLKPVAPSAPHSVRNDRWHGDRVRRTITVTRATAMPRASSCATRRNQPQASPAGHSSPPAHSLPVVSFFISRAPTNQTTRIESGLVEGNAGITLTRSF